MYNLPLLNYTTVLRINISLCLCENFCRIIAQKRNAGLNSYILSYYNSVPPNQTVSLRTESGVMEHWERGREVRKRARR